MVDVWSPIGRVTCQSRLSTIDEEMEVLTRNINQVGRDVLGSRIVVEFMVDDDPCTDTVLAHHFQQMAVLYFKPLDPKVILFPNTEEFW